jgi:hypothetical protein
LKVKKLRFALLGAFAILTVLSLCLSGCKNPTPLGSDSRDNGGTDDNDGGTAKLAYLDDTLSTSTDIATYKFQTSAGTTYKLEWMDFWGSEAYTGHIQVTVDAFYPNHGLGYPTAYPLFTNQTGAYTKPVSFSTPYDAAVTVEATCFNGKANGAGTFGIIVYKEDDTAKTNLLQERDPTQYWSQRSIGVGEVHTYTLSVPYSPVRKNGYLQVDAKACYDGSTGNPGNLVADDDGSGLFTAKIKLRVQYVPSGDAYDYAHQHNVSANAYPYSQPAFMMAQQAGTYSVTITVTGVTAGAYRIRGFTDDGSAGNTLQ